MRWRTLVCLGGLALGLVLLKAMSGIIADGPRRFPTSPSSGRLEPARFDVMLRGYCYAGSTIPDEHALGGFGTSENVPRALHPADNRRPGELTLLALPEVGGTFDEDYEGLVLLLVNASGAPVAFDASDSRLSIVQEARAADGSWKPIEYLPRSWCGNSYHRVTLPDRHYWQFIAPRYSGTFPTFLRFRLDRPHQPPLLSNSFAGSVNDAQFTRKPDPTFNIADPYVDWDLWDYPPPPQIGPHQQHPF
jgi:hypothetical protein